MRVRGRGKVEWRVEEEEEVGLLVGWGLVGVWIERRR